MSLFYTALKHALYRSLEFLTTLTSICYIVAPHVYHVQYHIQTYTRIHYITSQTISPLIYATHRLYFGVLLVCRILR